MNFSCPKKVLYKAVWATIAFCREKKSGSDARHNAPISGGSDARDISARRLQGEGTLSERFSPKRPSGQQVRSQLMRYTGGTSGCVDRRGWKALFIERPARMRCTVSLVGDTVLIYLYVVRGSSRFSRCITLQAARLPAVQVGSLTVLPSPSSGLYKRLEMRLW